MARSTGSVRMWQWIPTSFNFVYSRGGSSGFDCILESRVRGSLMPRTSVVLGPRAVSFSLEIEPPLPACTCGVRQQRFLFSIDKGEGQFQGSRGVLDCRFLGLTRWEHMM